MSNLQKIYWPNGNIKYEYWCKNGAIRGGMAISHRLDGPAVVHYYEDGSVKAEFWYKDDRRINKEDFKKLGIKAIKQMKALSMFTPLELIRLK